MLWVVTSVSGPTSESDPHYVEGMQLAEQEINDAGGVAGRDIRLDIADDHGDPAEAEALVNEAMGARPAAVLVVGPASAVSRPEIEAARVPLILLGGDLYTSMGLFRYTFQTTVPILWQARVLAHYLVNDRGHAAIALVTQRQPEETAVRLTFQAALAEEGSELTLAGRLPPGGEPDAAVVAADAVVGVGDARFGGRLAGALGGLDDGPQIALSSDALQPAIAHQEVPPGTVTCYPYTWSGWAEMIPRVGHFRDRFSNAFGHVPAGLEQEGYDAVRAIAEALERTGGRDGDALVRALEAFRDETYSSIPIRLGPDDHVLAEQSQLGLFAVDDEVPPPDEASSLLDWRPLMRTFTTDGQKVNLLDRDKRLFFPFWRLKRPSPQYWRSNYGIVTRPGEDPLH